MTTRKRCEMQLISNKMKGGADQMEEQIIVKKCTCNKCGHSWIPRTEEIPTTCANPECRSPNWNRPRQIIPYSEDNAKQ